MRVIVIASLLLVGGCFKAPSSHNAVDSIAYRWEPKAQLCFALLHSYEYGDKTTSIAHVPDRACSK